MLRNGFSLRDILGKDYSGDGLSLDQMSYYFKACSSVDAWDIDNLTMAYARVNVDSDGQKKIEQNMNKMRDQLFKYLLRK